MKAKQFLFMAVFGLMATASLTSCNELIGTLDDPIPPKSATVTITTDDLKLFVDDSETRVGTANSGATVSYSSSDESVAKVDATGKVTAIGVGTTTITAAVEAIDNYTAASASYKVVVSKIDVRLNPLYYVAEKDVESISAGVVTFDSSEPKSLTEKKQYTWSEAMSNFANGTSSYDTYWDASAITDASNSFTYHLPCLKEWNAVIPADFTDIDAGGNTNPNIFGSDFYKDGGCTFKKTGGGVSYTDWPDVECMFGYDTNSKAGIRDYSYWNAYSDGTDVRYAIRFLGTDHCSVWKYQAKDNGIYDGKTDHQYVLVVTAKIIDKLETTDASLEAKLNEYRAKDDDWWDYNNENAGAVQREFYTLGHNNNTEQPDNGFYWSTTNGNRGYSESSIYAEARPLCIDKNTSVCIGSHTRTHPFTVRLFRK